MLECLIIPKFLDSQFCFAEMLWCPLTPSEVRDLGIQGRIDQIFFHSALRMDLSRPQRFWVFVTGRSSHYSISFYGFEMYSVDTPKSRCGPHNTTVQ